MKHRVALAALLALFAAQAARADVTIRRTMTVNLGSSFPAAIQDMLKQQLASSLPTGSVIRIKGTKSYADMGPLAVLSDSASNQVTLLNPKTKQYATGSFSDYIDKLAGATQAAMPTPTLPAEAQQILQSMKIDVQTKKTGQVGAIQGILAEESVITLTMGMSVAGTAMPVMRMEMHCWIAQPNEVARVGGLQELTDYTARNKSAYGDPTEMLSKIFAQMPGMGEQLRKEMTAFMSIDGSLMLKMSVGAYMPAMAQMMQQAGQSTAGLDPNAPMMQLQNDVTELSTAPIDDSVFAVPADYQAAPLEDLVKAMLPTLPRPKPAGQLEK